MTSVAGDGCVLVLEDLHWADPDTAAVVEYVADNARTTPVLCMVTTRLEGSDHVGRVLSDLAARRSATRLELRRLTTDELGTMVSMCLGGEVVDASVMSLIGDFADGLPFLVEELLTTSVADGTIRPSADGWRVEAAGAPAVPERFAELVRRRMGSLDDDAARVVRVEVAVGQGRFVDAELLARSSMKIADHHQDHGLRAATALVIGRCERGRGEGNPAATFDSVVRIGREHGLPSWQLRGLMERSSLALWEYEPPQGILAAREHALNAGALVVVAHLDTFLAWQTHDRRNTDQIEPAARRCIDLADRLRLPTLHGVATVSLAVAAAHEGDRERMDRLLVEADAISGDHADVVALGGVARATYWIDRDDLRRAGTALGQMMQQLRLTPAVACPERGVWALFQALDGDEAGAAAIDELDAYVGPNHVMIDSYRSYARAVVSGRRGALDDANRHVALAERVHPTPWFQHHARRLVAETAHADGWGDPITWLRDAYGYFETRGDDRLASSCRSLLGTLGAALPRQRRRDERVPPRLRALGVSAREADVLELLADARSTRSIAETLHVSPKTVERHIANLATKLGVEGRTAVVAFAARSALDPVD